MAVTINAIELTKKGFIPYGSIISPQEEVASLDESAKNANQGTAIKILQVSEVEKSTNITYAPNWNLFRCFPQPHLKVDFSSKKTANVVEHTISVLEKHPNSSQTFLPMGRPENEVSYLIVVALEDTTTGQPDLSTLKAFLCKGTQAVTYGAGIWHAPMIVLGTQEYLDFGVLIYEFLDEGAPEKDCVEAYYGSEDIIVKLTI